MSGRDVELPRVEGRTTRQAHADLPEGSYEREIGRDGFDGPATHMYHAHPPTGWSEFEGPLRPRAFDTGLVDALHATPWDAPPLLENPHVKLRLWHVPGTMDALVRNADGDELLFVHEGEGDLFCDWGHLALSEGHHLVMPRGALWRIEASAPLRVLMIEATDSRYRLPDRGLLGTHALFDPAALVTPALDDAFEAQRSEDAWRVLVKSRERLSTITYPFNPLDAVGWKGNLAPLRLDWRDIRPVVSARYHLPPSVHTTFVADRFSLSTFCPRPAETDPGALKVPFFHSNDDFDEVIFYHRGAFFSRDEIRPGMLSFHPRGFSHGPHPGAYEASWRAPRSEISEVAVMLDARDPLDATPAAEKLEWAGYADSWKTET